MRITEQQMFKVVVVVGLAMVPVVLLAALVDPAIGAGLLFVEAVVATVWLVRLWREVKPFSPRPEAARQPDTEPEAASIPSRDS